MKNTVLKPLTEHSSRSANVGYKTAPKSKLKQPSVIEVNPLLGHLKRTTAGMEAFIVLFQRLTADVSKFYNYLTEFRSISVLTLEFGSSNYASVPRTNHFDHNGQSFRF